MSYGYDSRYYQQPRHDSYYTSPRDADAYAYSRHERTLAEARKELTDMRASNPYASSYPSSASYSSYEPRTSPPRRPTTQSYRSHRRKETWPPPPSVEDEPEALAKEAPSKSPPPEQGHDDDEPPTNTRGTVDQEYILDEIEQPRTTRDDDDRRFKHTSESSTDRDATARSNAHQEHRRRSFAERGHMPHINTNVPDPPLVIERERTPYGSSQTQKESIAPGPADFLRSPEPMTPSNSRFTTSDPKRDDRDIRKDSRRRSSGSRPGSSHRNSHPTSQAAGREPVFDSDSETDNTTHLRIDRKPARYSFVKSDLQRDDLRTNLRDTHSRPESMRRDSEHSSRPKLRHENSSGSSKEASYAQSPRSSSSSLNNSARRTRPTPVDTAYTSSSRPLSRPASPLPQTASSQLPTRLKESPPETRPSSRSGGRPSSPLPHSNTFESPSPRRGRFPVSEADRHTTFPPAHAREPSTSRSGYSRYESMPVPRPRIDVQSPSPAGRPSSSHSTLPYPMDDELIDVSMPPEQNYQFNHSPVSSPRQDYIEPPRPSSPSATGSPYIGNVHAQPSRQDTLEEPGLSRRARSNSVRSQTGRREKSLRRTASLDLKSLPDCPRSKASREHNDWYSLRGFKNFVICPHCYKNVFADTRFDVEFKQLWLDDGSVKRACNFSNPWSRLAWYLTIKQRRSSLDLLFAVADIDETYKPCPDDREKDTNEASWYGIVNQRDGMFVPNFAICSSDRRLAEALFPSMRGYFPRITVGYSNIPSKYMCSFRISSRRHMKYLELLMELDEEAQFSGRRPDIDRFVDLARDYAFKGECARDKTSVRKPWFFIPQLPEFTVCEECYDRFIWPGMQSKSLPTTIPRLFNKSLQLVPGEDPEVGSSCCLWSPRMRKVWMRSVEDEDFAYLKRKALERKKAQFANTRDRNDILRGLGNAEPGDSKYEWAKRELDILDREWAAYE